MYSQNGIETKCLSHKTGIHIHATCLQLCKELTFHENDKTNKI